MAQASSEGCNHTHNVKVSTQALTEFSKRVHYQLTTQRATGRASPGYPGLCDHSLVGSRISAHPDVESKDKQRAWLK